ncbi:permease prefix domain 1-containing protein [Tenggerimyces flavus]|uniref:Permease prefix domain 1-containing protein n=1 Tax=Tenggerimyces flavus TaxID=1708749 RepID=A0ABV7YC94_9ACTN|nr:permease prefix domain 1-containing protein [Tenggerimyces flavus]MBM7786921.1 hypothetical protein [Tenggerimyces flavus]
MSRGPIADHVAAVNSALRGPRRRRTDLLGELRDGLDDTAAAYVAAGLTADEAERRAVADSGTVADLAPAYQAELAADQGKRMAMLLGLIMPANYLVWNLLWRQDGSLTWEPGALYRFLSETVDLLGLASGGVAIVGLLMLVWFARRGRDSDRVVRGLVGAEAVMIAGTVGAAVWMNLIDPGQTQDAVRTVGTPVMVVGLLTVAALVLQARALWRTYSAMPRRAALVA